MNRISETHVAKIAIEDFDVAVDNLECNQFIVVLVDTCHKKQAGISIRVSRV